MNRKKLLIVDVSNLFYRSFFGSESLVTSYGLPVQALHGFVRGMNAIMRDHKPDYVALAMEGEGPSFRKEIEPLYKANRSEVNEDLKKQLEMLPRLIDALGYKMYKVNGFEGDDVIGTLTMKSLLSYPNQLKVEIVSSDKDFAQLIVGDQVNLLDLMKGVKLGAKEVRDKYGVWPYQFVDYLAIVGDSADNIKGVDGVGPKGASKLLEEYGSLDMIYSQIQGIKGTVQKKLMASKDSAFKARVLAKISTDININFDLEDAAYKGPKTEELRKLFRELEFRELEATMLGNQVQNLGGVSIGVRS